MAVKMIDLGKLDQLTPLINLKKKELASLVESKKSLLDKEVYEKSVELDQLLVQYMRANR